MGGMPSKSPFRRPRRLKRAKVAAQRRHNLMTISVYSVDICHAPNLAVGCKVPVLAIATLRATRCPPLTLRMALAPFTTHAALMTEPFARHRTTTTLTSVVYGKSASVRVDLGGRLIIKTKNNQQHI